MVDLKYYRKWAKIHPNFMTPHISRLIDISPYIIELSEGTGFKREPIFGVTVLRQCGNTFENMVTWENINKMFYSRQEATKHINQTVKPLLKALTTILSDSPCLGRCGNVVCGGLKRECLIFQNYIKANYGVEIKA
jgi:hypothetical protein